MKKLLLIAGIIANITVTASDTTSEEKIFFKKEHNKLFQELMYIAEKQKLHTSAGKISGANQSIQVRKSDIKNLKALAECFNKAQTENDCSKCKEWGKKHYIYDTYTKFEDIGIPVEEFLDFVMADKYAESMLNKVTMGR